MRWALEEAGLPYEQRLLGFGDNKSEGYRRLQPFGQVPVYETDGLVLFESGSIVLHIAERSTALLPGDAEGRARATTWMFSALNTLEPAITSLVQLDLNFPGDEAVKRQRQVAAEAVQGRLDAVAAWLGNRDYLEDRFTAGDLLMVTVLLRLKASSGILDEYPNLSAYVARGEARPAYKRAFDAQLAVFKAASAG